MCGRTWRSLSILVQARDQASYEDTVEQVRGILRAIRKVPPGKEDDFEIFSNDSLISQFKSFTLTVRLGAAVVSSIALLAAGIGIMNIMLVSVTERTREIGIRIAVGARERDVLTQFLVEAVVMSGLGGIAGILLGLAITAVAVHFLNVPFVPSPGIVFIAFVFSAGIGIAFGYFPAQRAARLDPIEALRHE